jgi:hypothetical protein
MKRPYPTYTPYSVTNYSAAQAAILLSLSILTPEQQPLLSNFRLDVARASSLITADATNTADVLKALILH